MAYNLTKMWLGFEDEYITDKHKGMVNFTTNKIGGKPDWTTSTKIDNPVCSICQLPRPLVLQIYAPLENSSYHRTLYLFACVNPNCWNLPGSWICVRSQTLEKSVEMTETSPNKFHVSDWCQGADDWDDDNNANMNEENGNVVNCAGRVSDEEDESCSFEDSIRIGFDSLSVDDRNANVGIGEAKGEAVGRLHSPRATAEIEGDESELISIDTPTHPQRDLIALLQEVEPLPQDICYHKTQLNQTEYSSLQFVPFFMSYVWEESDNYVSPLDRHAKELALEYQRKNEDITQDDGESRVETYEKSSPAHGDKMFFYFMNKIKTNAGQLVRYSRDGGCPLLLNLLKDIPKKCKYCNEEMTFEFQVLPTLIPKLRLTCDMNQISRLEFGTVIVFTCSSSCWSHDTNFREEVIILQNEQ